MVLDIRIIIRKPFVDYHGNEAYSVHALACGKSQKLYVLVLFTQMEEGGCMCVCVRTRARVCNRCVIVHVHVQKVTTLVELSVRGEKHFIMDILPVSRTLYIYPKVCRASAHYRIFTTLRRTLHSRVLYFCPLLIETLIFLSFCLFFLLHRSIHGYDTQ